MARLMRRFCTAFAALLLATLPSYAQTGSPKTKAAVTTEVNTNLQDNTSGQITPFIMRQTLLDMMTSYQQYGCVNAQTGTTYTIATTDYGCLLTFANAGAVSVTLPQANGAFNPFNVFVTNKGPGTVTIAPSVSTINGASSLVLTTGQGAWIVSDGSNYQVFVGSGGGGASGVSSITTDNSINANPSVGSVTLSLATAHSNTWSVTQTFGAGVVFTGNLTGTQTTCLGLTSLGVLATSTSACGTGSGSTSIAAGTNITTSGTASNVTINVVATPTFTNITSTIGAFTGFLTATGVNVQTETVVGNLTAGTAQFTGALTGTTSQMQTRTGATLNLTGNLTGTTAQFSGLVTGTTASWAGNLTAATAQFTGLLTGTTAIFSGNLTAPTAQFASFLTAGGTSLNTATVAGNLTAGTAQFTGQITGTSAVFQTVTTRPGGPLLPSSEYVGGASGTLAPTFYIPATSTTGAGQNAFEGIGVAGTVSTVATASIVFNMPEIVPAGTLKLRLLTVSTGTGGAVSVAPLDQAVSASAVLSAFNLLAETTSTVSWAAGTNDTLIEKKFTLQATPTSNQILFVIIGFTSTTGNVTVWQPSIVWE